MNFHKLILVLSVAPIFCCNAQEIGRVKASSLDVDLHYTNVSSKSDQNLVKILSNYDYLNSGHTLLNFSLTKHVRFLVKHKDNYAGEIDLLLTMLKPIPNNDKCALFYVERVKFKGDKIIPYGYYARVFREEKLWNRINNYLKTSGGLKWYPEDK